MKIICEKEKWFDKEVIQVVAGAYEAKIVPSIGGNVISLVNTEKNIDILNKPCDSTTLSQNPFPYGIPPLFMPNRIDRGSFEFENIKYQFPIVDQQFDNALHGFLATAEWEVTGEEIVDTDKVIIELTYNHDKNVEAFEYFPIQFRYIIRYIFSNDGLRQEVEIKNLSEKTLPLGIGFHTTFNLIFNEKTKIENVKIKLSVDKKIELSNRQLPTGKIEELMMQDKDMIKDGMDPLCREIDDHYTSKPILYNDREFHGAIIEDVEQNLKIFYEVDKGYNYWVIWNNNTSGDFFSIEPQSCKINAVNMTSNECEQGGIIPLKSQEVFKLSSRIWCE